MRILVGWDDPAEADLLGLYLGVDVHDAVVAADAADFLRQAAAPGWDVCLLSLAWPDADASFALFREVRRLQPDCPVVGGCRADAQLSLARFLTHGLRSYLVRDAGQDYLFLAKANLESVVEAVRAEREQKLAERLREEVDSVRKLQESILPRLLQCPPGYRVAACYEPSQLHVVGGRPVIMAGGDYYDVFRLDDSNVVVLIGDASGHGMKACMSIVAMHTLVQLVRNQQYRDTGTFIAQVNDLLCEQSLLQSEGGFITLLYGILRADRHEFQWTSAGHPLPLLFRQDSGTCATVGTKDGVGLPLGVFPGAEYESHTLTLPPRSRLLIYTDGLAEAMAPGTPSREFGIGGVTATLGRTAEASVDAALRALFDDSLAFTAGAGRHDDTSAVLLERGA